ncbi:MAG TPA: ATP-binding protein [Anaerolineae bacterium]|nr:ATP-binding protein [Anaerolineae bacterium]
MTTTNNKSAEEIQAEFDAYREMVESQTQAMLDVVAAVAVGNFDVPVEVPEGIEVLSELTVGLSFMLDELRDFENKQDTYQSAIEERLDELRRVNHELDQFAYIVSHDLKAPARNIGALVDILQEELEGKLDEDTEEYMALLQQRTELMHEMIDGVLAYARAGYASKSIEEVDVGYLVHGIAKMLARPEGIKLEIMEGEWPTLHADTVKLAQVFNNLMENGVKYHDKDEGVVRVRFVEEEDCYQFLVEDDGPGVAEEHFEKIFSLFGQLQSRDKSGSSGVGLTTSKKIVEGVGGEIGVESVVGEGSVFWFKWPK